MKAKQTGCLQTVKTKNLFRILYVARFRTFAFSHFAFYTSPVLWITACYIIARSIERLLFCAACACMLTAALYETVLTNNRAY